MIDVDISSYNDQLHFALSQDKSSSPFDARLLQNPLVEIDYHSRRMSSSATSDDDSSLHSRTDKRSPPLSPKRSQPWSLPPSPDPPSSALAPDSDPDARVQLPSLASTLADRNDLRRASLPALYPDNSRLRLPYPIHHRPSQSASSALSSYQFPPDVDSPDQKPTRPRVETDTNQVAIYPDLSSLSNTAVSSASPFNFSPLNSDYSVTSRSSTDDWNASSIPRPNSTPGSAKYDDPLRQPHSMFGGVQRISGHDRSPVSRLIPANTIKTEADWNFSTSTPDFSMSPSSSSAGLTPNAPPNPSISVSNSPNRSPQSAPIPNPAPLTDRPPQRKRGKLPKPVTDFLKDWLHRHSDHPYPSEEEKKQLCHATGLSMSQVSNWMINARRRILAPARHSTAGPTTTTPFATRSGPVGMGMPIPGVGPLTAPSLDPTRRMSVDSLQLYYPMSLQSLGHDPHGHHLSSTRQMVGMSRSLSSSHATVGSLSALGHHGHGQSPYAPSDSYAHGRLSYSGGSTGALHPSAHSAHHSGPGAFYGISSSPGAGYLGQTSMYSQTPGYASHHHAPQGGSPGARVLTPGTDDSSYRFPEHSASPGPQSGSGYGTPQ